MANTVAIILARGGSKGIPGKNIIDFCGKPLITWTLEQLKQAKGINSIWVSSDSEEILNIGQDYGIEIIHRPIEISGDLAASEAGWLHALDVIEGKIGMVDIVLAPQVTSPLRESKDFEKGICDFKEQKCDSMFSASIAGDSFLWEKTSERKLNSVNYNYKDRKRRQDIAKQYVENGSFYLFKPEVLRKYNNRLGGKIGMTQMESWKMFQIDEPGDIKFCEVIMRGYGVDKL